MTDERVSCFFCQKQFWKSECAYFNHGDDGEGGEIKGHTCEGCQQKNKEDIDQLYKRFLRMCDDYKKNPPQKPKQITFES